MSKTCSNNISQTVTTFTHVNRTATYIIFGSTREVQHIKISFYEAVPKRQPGYYFGFLYHHHQAQIIQPV